MQRIPPPGTRGAFLLKAPYNDLLNPALEYTVVALRSFDEMRQRKSNVLELVYTPAGLTQADYQIDIDNNVTVVVLSTNAGTLVYVPASYILVYPHMGSIPYTRLVLGVSMGMLPDDYDTTQLQAVIASTLSDYTGVEPTVHVMRAATQDSVSEQQHVQLVTAREAAVTMRETERAKNVRLSRELQIAEDKIAFLEALVVNLSS